MNKDKLLSFEEFEKERNGFYLHFVGPVGKSACGDVYRSQLAYMWCSMANPEFAKLAEELLGRDDRSSPEYLKKLYSAYLLMHPYAETNYELFA